VSITDAFDDLASRYDREFSDTVLGMHMRRAVRRRCGARFTSGARVLEMNCGTGEDALWLSQRGIDVLATDLSARMVEVAQRKSASRASTARFVRLGWENLSTLAEGSFDGALSNFGGLNCVADLEASANALAEKLRPGATAIICLMGPLVPWEWVWFLSHGKPRTALRRLSRRGAQWRGMTIRYPSVGQTCSAFAGHFDILRIWGLGALLPPTYMEGVAARCPGIVKLLDRVERSIETLWPVPHFSDHFVIELERL
jgi:SAM-dependent methyltransferase